MMSTTTIEQTTTSRGLEARVLSEAYGPGAWHGPDLKAALADVTPDLAFWRPAGGRHNIAEVALHHAFCARAVRGQLSGIPPEPFVLDGEDWFALPDESLLPWSKILAMVEAEQQRLAALVADIGHGQSPMTDAERFSLVLGITCHAIYHAGQVQLLKRLHVR
jgi:hypothetical protein